ncbi:putative transposase for insertion sequence element [Streptomyces aurantiacus JA 4570]|uniref:Putative transposase for insertion sequence element n=1 Tax=Streptomyces aurantiacus JA 4570 TaxID=1286094 RepID=S3ZQR5_9ACTN|nr:putative transposase for insertion sequence element [Streptomyces aurantiacus JA 4570]
MFTAAVYVLTSGCARRHLAERFGVSPATAHRRFTAWTEATGGIVPCIARPGIDFSERLGRHRWKIERSLSWLFGYRRLTARHERKGFHFLAFLPRPRSR